MGFHGEALLAPRPTPKLEDHPWSAVRYCLFNLFAAALHIGVRSSIRNLRTRNAVVTGTHITWCEIYFSDRNMKVSHWISSVYFVKNLNCYFGNAAHPRPNSLNLTFGLKYKTVTTCQKNQAPGFKAGAFREQDTFEQFVVTLKCEFPVTSHVCEHQIIHTKRIR